RISFFFSWLSSFLHCFYHTAQAGHSSAPHRDGTYHSVYPARFLPGFLAFLPWPLRPALPALRLSQIRMMSRMLKVSSEKADSHCLPLRWLTRSMTCSAVPGPILARSTITAESGPKNR